MKIIVERFISDKDTTISRVWIVSDLVCFGLEDEYREFKIPKETRIPAGKYKVALRIVGGFHSRYKKRFPDFHKGMLHILNVPGFEYILIHCGNTDDDTAGCLLVGEKAYLSVNRMTIVNSAVAYKNFYKLVVEEARNGYLEIEFKDND